MSRSSRPFSCSRSIVIVALSVALVSAGCSDTDTTVVDNSGYGSTTVTDEGLQYASRIVTVTAPAGVAPSGTSVTVSRSEARLPGEWARFATLAAPPIEIAFDDGVIPEQPITIDFEQVLRADDTFLITESGGVVSVLPRENSSTLTTRLDRTGVVYPVTFDAAKYAATTVESVSTALAARSEAPDCARPDGIYPDAGARVSAVEGDVVRACVAAGDEGVELSLHGASAAVWRASTSPAWTEQRPSDPSTPDAAAYSAWTPGGPGDAVVFPDAATTLSTPDVTDTQVRVVVDPVLTQVRAAALAVSTLVPVDAAETIADSPCIPDLVEAGSITAEATAPAMTAVASCIAGAVGGTVGSLIGLVVDGDQMLWTNLEAPVRAAVGGDEVAFDIVPIPVDEDRLTIPVAEAEPFLGVWTGPIDQPGGRPYSAVVSLRHDGTTVLGTVDYPEVGCRGSLDSAQLVDGVLAMRETITENGNCVEVVDLELSLRGNALEYYVGPRTGADATATGELSRQAA